MFRYILIFSVLLFQSLYALSDKELAIAINLAGKQRMLTQKISKEALLISLNIDKEQNRKKLEKSVKLFDKTLNGLLYGDQDLNLAPSKNKKVEAKLKEVQALWEPFYKNAKTIYSSKNPPKSAFIYIDKNNLKLLKTMNEAVSLYTSLGNKGTNKLKIANDINLAGKQRMLTQKMAKDILRYKNGLEPQEALKSLNSSKELFDKTLNGLYSGDKELNLVGTNLPKIRKQLDIVKSRWSEAKELINKALKSKDDKKIVKELISKLDETKVQMNKAVVLYTKSLNRQKQFMAINSIISGFMHKKGSNKHLINLAGKQRMLTQRVSKLSIECALNLRDKSCKMLNNFTTLYERTLNGFLNGDKELELEPSKNSDEIAKIEHLQKLWKPFKNSVEKVEKTHGKDKKALDYILSNNEELLKESNNLVTIFVKNSSKDVNYIEKALLKIVNIAGRERMLTQKMTKEYLQQKELNNTNAYKKMKKTMTLFENSLNDLINGNKQEGMPKVTNLEIKKQLQKVKKIWSKLKPLYLKQEPSKKELILLLKANPILLKEMNKAVYMIDSSTDY